MKKTRKVTLLTILALVCAAVFAACDSGGNTLPKLATPANLQISGTTLTWDAVDNASGYVVNIDGTDNNSAAASYDLSALTTPKTYTIKVKAKGNGTEYTDSGYSAVKEYVVEPIVPSEGLVYTLNTDNLSYSVSKGTATDENIIIPSIYNGKPVTSIGHNAFYRYTGLTGITIPDSVTNLDISAFYGCTSLTGITIPDSVTSIRSDAFRDCTSLTGITIPDSVTSIGSNAFDGCVVLESITIGNSVTSIVGNAFYRCTELESITVDGGNTTYRSENNCLIEIATNTLIAGCKTSVIPDSVTSIGDSAFYGCTGLTSITIPGNVTSIDYGAFYGCTGLESITIPDSVTSISSDAFRNCTSLTGITIPDSVTSIGESAFSDCTGLESVTIGNSVTIINFRAFSGCTGLESITFTGTMAQWNAVNKGSDYLYNTKVTTIQCSDGNVNL